MKVYLSVEDVLREPWQKNPEPLRNKSGVYMIKERKTGNLVYIGQSSDIGHRVCPSCHPVYRRNKHDLYVLFVDDDRERKYMEGRFIAILQPPINERRGIMPEIDDDLLKAYYDSIF